MVRWLTAKMRTHPDSTYKNTETFFSQTLARNAYFSVRKPRIDLTNSLSKYVLSPYYGTRHWPRHCISTIKGRTKLLFSDIARKATTKSKMHPLFQAVSFVCPHKMFSGWVQVLKRATKLELPNSEINHANSLLGKSSVQHQLHIREPFFSELDPDFLSLSLLVLI